MDATRKMAHQEEEEEEEEEERVSKSTLLL
jgi:hypothetical protein